MPIKEVVPIAQSLSEAVILKILLTKLVLISQAC